MVRVFRICKDMRDAISMRRYLLDPHVTEKLLNKNTHFLLLSLFFLNLMDIPCTFHGLKVGYSEINPFFPEQNVIVKALLPAVLALFYVPAYYLCRKEEEDSVKKLLHNLLLGLVIFYAMVLVNNLVLIGLKMLGWG